jgi:type IV pilus assembly protein PilE
MQKTIARGAQQGFTLLELMITLAVIAILATIAIPYYFDYIQRSRIIEATTALGDMRSQMEKFYMDNRTYLNGGNCAVNNAMTAYNGVASNKFNLKAAAPCTATTYTLEADGLGPMTGFSYTINQQNAKVTLSTGAWGQTSLTCWVSKKDGTCL